MAPESKKEKVEQQEQAEKVQQSEQAEIEQQEQAEQPEIAQGPEKLVDIKTVSEMIGFKKTWIYNKIKEGGDFPKPAKIGRSIRWKLSAIQNWINEQK